MFGGTGSRGTQLSDTWSWDGTRWTSAANGPRSLVNVHMVDDPADGGVLLTGYPAQTAGDSSGGGCVVGSGGGTTGPGTVTAPAASVAPAPGNAVPGVTQVRPTGPPISDPLPTMVGGPSASPVAVPPVISCLPVPTQLPAPVEQTWLFRGGSWARVGGSSPAPGPDAQLTFDAATRQVVAVSAGGFTCSPPMEAASGGFACPALGSSSGSTSTALAPVPCCWTSAGASSWTWSGGAWHRAGPTVLPPAGVLLLFNDPATRHATLMTEAGASGYLNTLPCASGGGVVKQPACTRVVPFITTWSWTGSAWREVSQQPTVQAAPDLAGAALGAVGSHLVVLTAAGETWAWAAGHWTLQSTVEHPSARAGATIAQGPGGTAVLFGGAAGLGVASLQGATGSDTWVWDGASWSHAGGVQPSMPALSACPLPAAPKLGCVEPMPAQVSPGIAPTPSP